MSVSRKSVWDQCTQQYKYKYHLGIPSPEEEPYYFVYGKIIHKIAEEYVRGEAKIKMGKLATDVIKGDILLERDDAGGPKAPPSLPPEYREKMPTHLRAVEHITSQLGTKGLLEHPFYYDLDGQGRHVKGFIDRLIPKGDSIFILDYKTSKKNGFRKNSKTITSDLQLRMYARVVQREFNIPANKIHAALYYLEGANLVGATFSQESLLSAEREMLEAYKQIQNTHEDSAVGNSGLHCNRCDYRSICPFFRNKKNYADAGSISPYILG